MGRQQGGPDISCSLDSLQRLGVSLNDKTSAYERPMVVTLELMIKYESHVSAEANSSQRSLSTFHSASQTPTTVPSYLSNLVHLSEANS